MNTIKDISLGLLFTLLLTLVSFLFLVYLPLCGNPEQVCPDIANKTLEFVLVLSVWLTFVFCIPFIYMSLIPNKDYFLDNCNHQIQEELNYKKTEYECIKCKKMINSGYFWVRSTGYIKIEDIKPENIAKENANNTSVEQVIKQKKGKRMPRVLRFAMYTGFIILLYRFIFNIEYIIQYLVTVIK